MNRSVLMVICGYLSLTALAQAQDNARQRPPEVSSPVVDGDGKVTLSIYAPEAKSVTVQSSDFPGGNPFGGGAKAAKGENGVWTATVGPHPPGSYRYQFNVDGLVVTDPRNTSFSETNSTAFSLVHIPGSKFSDLRDVPHGAVAQISYYSKSLKRFRRAHVYTPPGYENGAEKFPVLYLLHGATDCDASWSTIGRAGLVLDNLIADGKAKPMVVVMPMGHTGAFSFGGGGANFQQQMEEFQKDFENDLRPLVEKRYRLEQGRPNRAIAGLSMGGAQTINIAMGNLADYAYVGVFSSGVFGVDRGADAWIKQNEKVIDDTKLKEGLKLVWFATGKDDFLLKTTQETVRVLKEHKFDVTYEETDGGHTWINWREHYLPAFAQLLFQDGVKAAAATSSSLPPATSSDK